MKLRYVIGTLWLLAVLAVAACDPLEQEREQELVPVNFSAEVAGDMPATRAVNMQDLSKLKDAGFGVFGCYTGLHTYAESSVSTDFMHNQHVVWDARTSHWIYEPVKYWPGEEGHYVSFFAYAPYSDGSQECIPSFIFDHEVADPWILYRLAADVNNQVDLLYADPLLDRKRPTVSEPLTFTFKHALACVGDTVRIACSDNLRSTLQAQVDDGICTEIKVVLKKVTMTYTLTAKGRLVLWNRGSANWSVVQSEEVLTTRSVNLPVNEYQLWNYTSGAELHTKWTDKGHGVFCIPAEINGYAQVAEITVEYDIVRKGAPSSLSRSTSGSLALKPYVQEGKVLNINIEINKL